ncbi:thiamine phosphate synthase [Gramella sp. AN32]|uniref:Thiamine phosphate synthase n=2 Tax=Christiangramia antarctica TaxID=2058158 RepID=A0ABW5XAM3_9FLAO|nr:thiamine phosphate synthase [Gramella sp. AN32]
MMKNKKKGIYLIIDPSMDETVLLDKIAKVLGEEIVALQIWDNFQETQNRHAFIEKICALGHAKNVPVLINNHWHLLKNTSLDGVHFDAIPENWKEIKSEISKEYIIGLTCNNDLSDVEWAAKNQLDYISFCSLFPSITSNSCELVSFDTIRETTKKYSLPVFLAGGITPQNLALLRDLDFDGIAVVSGVMNAKIPEKAIQEYRRKLNL